jgi:hypothetical protein
MILDKTLLAAAAALLLAIGERPAYAYVDPGAGSLIYQTALTILLGLGFVLRRSRASLSRFVRRLSGRDVASDGGAESRD